MKINKLDINGFGKLENRVYTFQPGLNVVFGCNESGKSTLQAFIKGMFFGLKGGRRSKDGFLPPAKQYKPWNAQVYGGTMEYELDNGQRYIIGRNFEKNTLHIHDGYANNVTGEFPAGKDEGSRFAEQHLGLSEGCFERSVFIGQLQSVVNSEGKKILAERLMNIRQGGDEEVSYHKAVKALKDVQLSYVGSERSTTRPLNLIQSRLDKALEEERVGRKLHESSMDTFLELDQAKEERKRLEAELQRLLAIRNKLENNAQIQSIQDAVEKLKAYLDKLTHLDKEKRKINDSLCAIAIKMEDYSRYRDFSRDDADAMVSDNTRFHLVLEEYQHIIQEKEETEEKLKNAKQVLSQYGIFEQYGPKLEEVLNDVLHQDEEEIQKAREKTEKNLKIRGRMKSHKRFSIAGLAVAFLLMLGAVGFRSVFSETLLNIIMILSFLLFTCLGGVLFHSEKKQRLLMKEYNQSDAEYQKKRDKYEENKKLLSQWIKDVNVEHLQDFIRLKNLYENKKRQYESLQEEKEKLEEREEKLRNQKEDLAAAITSRLNKAGFQADSNAVDERKVQSWKDALEAYLSLFPSQKELEKDQMSIQEKMESLFREISLACGERMETREQLEKAIEVREEQLCTMDIIQVENEENISRIQSEVDRVNDEIQQNQMQIHILKTRLENIPDGESLQHIHEKIQSLTDEKEHRLFIRDAINVALQLLSDASLSIQRDYVPFLNQEMSNILSIITDGRYSDVKADDRLRLNLLSPGTPDWVLPEQLSSGTADQVYLALRLSAVRLVEKDGESIPLFFDEPFVQYDEERIRKALVLLVKESRRRQVFLFTCKEREVDMINELPDENIVHMIRM